MLHHSIFKQLSRLIEFETGIAVGTMVTDKLEDVSELISPHSHG